MVRLKLLTLVFNNRKTRKVGDKNDKSDTSKIKDNVIAPKISEKIVNNKNNINMSDQVLKVKILQDLKCQTEERATSKSTNRRS